MITLRQWEIFATIGEQGSFRRCADALGISPVSVSEHMRALEKHLGVPLFERTQGGPVQLTQAGRRAMDGVRDLLAHAHDFVETIVGDRPDGAAIAIAMHGFMMRNLGGAVSAWNLEASNPIQLQSHDASGDQLAQRILTRELQAAYFYSVDGHGDVGDLVGYEPLAIFVSDAHPLASMPVVTVQELAHIPSVSLSRDRPLRTLTDKVLVSLGVNPLQHSVETSEFGLILSSLRRGLGFTCMFQRISDEEVQGAGLCQINLDAKLPLLQIRRVTRRTAMRDGAMRSTLAMLEKEICLPNGLS